jgi:hypothetical protein
MAMYGAISKRCNDFIIFNAKVKDFSMEPSDGSGNFEPHLVSGHVLLGPQHLHVYPGKGFLFVLAEHKIDQLQQGCPRGRHVGEDGCIQYPPITYPPITLCLLLGGPNSRARQQHFRPLGGMELRGQRDEVKHHYGCEPALA